MGNHYDPNTYEGVAAPDWERRLNARATEEVAADKTHPFSDIAAAELARRADAAETQAAAEVLSAAGYDKINPAHYRKHPSGVECITVTEHFNFNLGNAIKYIWRAGEKPDANTVDDLKKAGWYVNREIERLGGKP